MASLTVSNICKNYGAVEVLRNVNLKADAGEFIVLVGPSGCGKSTLLALIAGLETITSGEISIGDRVVNNVPPKDRDIAMVFQSYALYPTMTVRGNITFGMESRGVPRADQNAAVERVAKLLQIEPLLKRKPSQLSGGQRQRVAMGRALVRDPQLFLFDEPLSNLDAKLRVEMRTEIKKLYKQLGKTTVYVTHDQIEAMTLATRIAVMHGGRLQQFAEPKVIYEQPANMFVAGFMGSPAMNFIPAEVADGRLRLTGDASLPLPAGTSLPNGRKVVLGLRPEHFSPGSGIRAPVEVVEPTGAETIVILRLGGQEITARFDPDSAPREGDAIDLAVAIDKASLFDPDTEERL
ncbi:MAG: sn-glycerol-3-phosphate ABC transporter ATP-binding protein UgpC [Geminicoccaceae bacterium]